MKSEKAERQRDGRKRMVRVWDIPAAIKHFMSRGCMVCGNDLRPSGGIVKFCSKSCRHARHQMAKFRRRIDAVDATAASVAALNKRAEERRPSA